MAPTDLVSQMYLAVIEEGPLWSLASGVTDYLVSAAGQSGTVRGLPTNAQHCSSAGSARDGLSFTSLKLPPGWRLQPAEWQKRAERRGAVAVLAAEDAHQLLLAPARWLVDTADGQACLSRTDSGMEHEATDWYTTAVSG
jgi:hypothetical protein